MTAPTADLTSLPPMDVAARLPRLRAVRPVAQGVFGGTDADDVEGFAALLVGLLVTGFQVTRERRDRLADTLHHLAGHDLRPERREVGVVPHAARIVGMIRRRIDVQEEGGRLDLAQNLPPPVLTDAALADLAA